MPQFTPEQINSVVREFESLAKLHGYGRAVEEMAREYGDSADRRDLWRAAQCSRRERIDAPEDGARTGHYKSHAPPSQMASNRHAALHRQTQNVGAV